MRGGNVTILASDSTYSFPRGRLLLISDVRSGVFSQWMGKLSIGFTGRSGNSEQSDFNAQAQLRRQSTKGRLELKYTGNFGSVNGVENVNNTNAGWRWELEVSLRLYVVPGAIDYSSDRYQNIDHKYLFGSGFGVALINARKTEWRVGFAAGSLTTEYRSVEEGTERVTRSGVIAPFTTIETDITSDIDLTIEYKLQIGVGENSEVFHHGTGTFSVDAFDDIVSIDFSVTWDRAENPTTDQSGVALKKDDIQTSIGVGIEF